MHLPAPANDLPVVNLEWLGIISTIAVAIYVSMMAIYYAKVYESQTELESEMRQHLATAAELRLATAEAERAGAAKAEFLAKMSHELRTPLNAVINYSEILLEDSADDGDEQIVSDLNKIHDAGKGLLKLINEVLDLSKIDAGMMELFDEECAIDDVVRRVVDEFRDAAAEKKIALEFSVASALPSVCVDQQKVQQVVRQIIENAVKFTQSGGIKIEVSDADDRHEGMFAIEIKDSGVGISPEELPHLFEHFTVLGDSSSSKYGGTGLGLALALRLCKLMGGHISATSRLGEGSCFTIILPLRRAATAPVVESASVNKDMIARLREKLTEAQTKAISEAA